MTKQLVFEDFKDRVGSRFTPCDGETPPIDLTLAEATLLPERHVRDGVRPPFSLIFVGAEPPALPQRLYRLLHDDMGEITLFLVPVGRDARGISYQALFN